MTQGLSRFYPNPQLEEAYFKFTWVLGYRWNRYDEAILMTVINPLQTEFSLSLITDWTVVSDKKVLYVFLNLLIC